MLRENSGNAMRFKTMCFKTLLYPLHDTFSRDDTLLIGELCQRENCHLIVQLFGESLPVPPMFAGNVGAAEVWAQRMSKRESQLQDRARALSEQLQKTGVSAEVRTSLGDALFVDDVIGLQARYSDLALIQRHNQTDQSFVKRLCHGVLFQSGRPLLVCGDSPPQDLKFGSVLLAWDGKLAASRAVSAALPLLQAADTIHVLCINEGTNTEAPFDHGWELSTYLSRHQLEVTLHTHAADGEACSSIIQKYAKSTGADLIAMGAYGHSRLKERIFGGTTIEMLEQCQLPLLMVH
jgi:nucleotide-binding universal stress UspA family protein